MSSRLSDRGRSLDALAAIRRSVQIGPIGPIGPRRLRRRRALVSRRLDHLGVRGSAIRFESGSGSGCAGPRAGRRRGR
jgi:hypothetical protein